MKTKQENNRLIAEFMGFTQGKADEIRFREDWFDNNGVINGQRNVHLHFDTSWEWLMPVVEKIEGLGYEVLIGRISCNINEIFDRDNPIASMVCGDISKKSEIVYDAIVTFINWHNSQRPLSS